MSGNKLGYTCPSCGSGECIRLWIATDVFLTEDGLELGKNPQWDGDAQAECGECGWEGEERELLRVSSDAA